MKKHILGLMLFVLIVGAAAVVYSLFYIPNETSNRTLKREKKDITFEVLGTQLDLNTGILTSEVNLKWNGDGNPPEKVTAGIHLFTAEDDEEGLFNEKQEFIQPFENNNKATVLIKYKVRYDLSYSSNKNLYALIDFSQNEKFEGYIEGKEDLSKAFPVLFIHGENSRIRR